MSGILGLGSWLFVQCALLVVHYGFNKILPLYVLWLPSIILGGILVIILIVIIIVAITT